MNETRSLPVAEISRWIPRVTDRSVSSICKEISIEGEIRGERRENSLLLDRARSFEHACINLKQRECCFVKRENIYFVSWRFSNQVQREILARIYNNCVDNEIDRFLPSKLYCSQFSSFITLSPEIRD